MCFCNMLNMLCMLNLCNERASISSFFPSREQILELKSESSDKLIGKVVTTVHICTYFFLVKSAALCTLHFAELLNRVVVFMTLCSTFFLTL